jgi:hypothetical protein
LLADLPRERIAVLAERWGSGSPDRPGIAAALYRTVSDRERLAVEVGKLEAATRLILGRLAASPSGLTLEELGLRLPFTDETIERALELLGELGLAWQIDPAGRELDRSAKRWFVPRDLATSLVVAARASRNPDVAPGPNSPVERPGGRLEPVIVANWRVSPGGEVREYLAALVARPAQSVSLGPESSPPSFARRAGIALGVLDRQGSVVRLGPRAEQWSKLAPADQTRALARLWLVDDTLIRRVPAKVRTQVMRAIKTAEPGEWYDVGSVARVVAEQMSELIGAVGAREIPTDFHRPSYAVTRNEVAQAVVGLHWIGVVDVAGDARGTTRAIRLTVAGAVALA